MKLFLLGASAALADNSDYLRKETDVQNAHFSGQEIIFPPSKSNKQWNDCGKKPKTASNGESVRCNGSYCASVCPIGWRSQGRWKIKCKPNNTWSHTEFSPCITCPDISNEISKINASTQNTWRKNLPVTQFFCDNLTDQLMVGNASFMGQKNLKCLCKKGQNGKRTCDWQFMGNQWKPAGPMVSSITCKSKEYKQFCITVKSSPDEELCYHPMVENGAKEWIGGDISINHNGKTIATMKRGTRTFKHCLPMTEVDVENDVFQLTNYDNDGVCITSLEVNKQIVTVGMNNQPNFWLDGDNPNCLSNHVATPHVTIKNGEVTTDCSGDFCVRMTSSASDELCYHPLADGAKEHKGGAIKVTHNGVEVATAPAGFSEWEFCMDGVDEENDEFKFLSTKDDGVCVTSLTMGDEQVFAGPDNDSPSFWIDGNDNNCLSNHISSSQMTVVNGEVTSSECDPKFCIVMTSSADEDLCKHPKAPSGGPSDYPGGPLSIKQNGKVIGSMKKGTNEFRLCLEYDQVNIEDDVFEISNPHSDGVCVTSLTVDGNAILIGDQPNFWVDGDDNDCTDGFVSTQKLTVKNNALASSECDPKFCIRMSSSADEVLCQHPVGKPKDYPGGSISIKQNGKVIGSTKKGFDEFRLCLEYDQVNIEEDVFEFSQFNNDGVCITSLTVDGNQVLVGNNQPNFWLDGDSPGCTPSFIASSKMTIVNGEATVDGCTDYCINVTSGQNYELCDHPKWPNAWEKWSSSGDIAVNYNGNQVGTMESGFTDFEYCMPRWSVDIENDEFQLSTPHTKGVCVTSFTVDGQAVLVGPNNDLPSFWLDDNVDCLDNFVATTQVTVKNGQVSSSYCDNDLYCIKVTSGLDLDKCHHPSWPDAAENSWTGAPAQIKRNGRNVATLFEGFTEFEYCMIRSEVDIENDKFKIETTATDGFCVHALTVDGEEVLVGKNKDLASFWIDDNVECRDDFMASTQVTVQNGELISDYCN